MFCCWLRACRVRSLHKGTALLRGFAPYRLPLCIAVVIRFSCDTGRLIGIARRIRCCCFSCCTGQHSSAEILHCRAAARMGFRLGMYGLLLLRILRDRAARSRLHGSCMMIRRIGRCFSCRGRGIVLRRCHMPRRASCAGRYGCFPRGVRLLAISGRRSLRECTCHLFCGSLYSIRLRGGCLRGNRFLTGYGIRAALLRRRAMMIAVCIRGRIDIGSAASSARARTGRCARFGISAAAALAATVPADGMRRIGHQRTNDHHGHCAREAAA